MKSYYTKIALLGALSLVVAFSGCSGGASSSPNSSTTKVYFTDAPIAGYSQVLVTVLSAQLRNTATGTTAVIADFTSSGGASFDLTDLSGVLRLVNIVDIPVGTYDRVEVLLANSAILLDQSGNTVVAKFAPDGDTYLLGVNVNLTISKSPTSTLVFDFDLSHFSYDQLTGILRAVLIPVDSADTYASYGRLDELEGTILTVDQANSRLTIHLEHSPLRLTVILDPSTKCTGVGFPVHGQHCFTFLTPGTHISVKGILNPAAGSILASVIKSHHRISGDPALLDKVEGIVSSVDATSGTFSLFITESRGFVPVPNPDGTITIRVDTTTLWENITGINFLAPRMNVEILGAWNPASNELLAAKVEAKGADDDDPTSPNPPPPDCTTVPQKTLLNYGASAFPVFEVEHITLSSVLTGTDVSVTASNGQTYFLVNTTKLEKEPSFRLCVDDLFTYLGKTIEIKYVVGSGGEKVALKLEVK